MTLAACPIAAQYGVYAHSDGYNLAIVSHAERWNPMIIQRCVAFALATTVVAAIAAQAAELPSQRGQHDKSKKTEYVTPCNVAGSPGVLASDGVCVRFSGYVSSRFGGSQLK
jgi:hypothetical protein